MRKIENIVYNEKGKCLDLLLPEGEVKAVLVYFHGGGLDAGDYKQIWYFPPYLTDRGIAIATVDYRMYPEVSYPDFIEDCADAVLWAKQNAKEYGLSDKLFVGGSSAGGYLSMMLCFCDDFYEKRGLKQSDITGYIHDSGQPTAHFNVLKYKGIDSRRVIVDDTAPLYHIGKAKEYPPMIFTVADDDMEGRLEQTEVVISTLKHFEYDQNKIEYRILHGTHCSHLRTADQNGDNIAGKFMYEFISKYIKTEKTFKVLSIGNSFSQDAHNKLHALAIANDVDLYSANLYIGGCTLKCHWENIENNAIDYDLQLNGSTGLRKISIEEALLLEEWDVITLQQASAYSQNINTYTPYTENIAKYVREKCPDAKIWFHQTWAYENDYFANGERENKSQQKAMYENILTASKTISEVIDAPLIKAGVAIQAVRENVPEFDYTKGGMSLNRDGYHLSYDYGRFAAAYTWLYELTGVFGDNIPFANLDKTLTEKITKTLKDALK